MKKFILSLILALLMAGNVFAATISKSFTATGAGANLSVKVGDSFTYSVSGTFSGTVLLQKSDNYFTWSTVATITGSSSGTVIAESTSSNQLNYRFYCDAYTSGTIVTSMTDATGYDVPVQEFKNKNGKVIAYTTENGMVVQDLTVIGTATGTSGGNSSQWTTYGNVGVGSASPEDALVVNGDMVLKSPDGIIHGQYGNTIDFIDKGNGSFLFKNIANVGIGTATPAHATIYAQSSSGALGWFQHDDTNFTIGTDTGMVSMSDILRFASTSVTVASNGSGTRASATVTPTTSNTPININDPDGCDITLGETGMQSGAEITLHNGTTSSGNIYMTDQSGVQELAGPVVLFPDDTISFKYQSSEWHETSRTSSYSWYGSDTGIFPRATTYNVGIGTTDASNGRLIVRGGNVGIGSANPGQVLDIVGSVRISTGTAGQATCWKADKTLGQCTGVVGAGGACTCS